MDDLSFTQAFIQTGYMDFYQELQGDFYVSWTVWAVGLKRSFQANEDEFQKYEGGFFYELNKEHKPLSVFSQVLPIWRFEVSFGTYFQHSEFFLFYTWFYNAYSGQLKLVFKKMREVFLINILIYKNLLHFCNKYQGSRDRSLGVKPSFSGKTKLFLLVDEVAEGEKVVSWGG